MQTHALRKDGRIIPTEVHLSRYMIHGQKFFLALVRDITERLTRERELGRTNGLYATLNAVNRTIVSVKTREDLFEEICRITVQHAGFDLVWVAWHDPVTHAIAPIASAGEHQGYLDDIKVYSDQRPEATRSLWCLLPDRKARHPSRPPGDDTPTNPWRERAIAHGLRSTTALPFVSGESFCAVFSVYAGETNAFQDREVRLLEEIADSISFALDHLDQEEKRRQAEKSLLEREAVYHSVIETCSDGFAMTDEAGCIVEVN